MKKKTLVHASSAPAVNSTIKKILVPQKTQAQRTVISAVSTWKSLTIGVNKGTITPTVHVQNSIVIS